MCKKLTKIILIVLFLFVANMTLVFAGENDTNIIRNYYDGYYAVYDAPDRVRLFYAERFTMNGDTAYCIEPGIAINTSVYSSTTDWSITGFSDEVKNYIKLVAYYGYDYPNHQTMRYYFAAQELIWEKVSGRAVGWIYGEDRYGPQMDIETEKNNILTLMNNHNKRPSFDDQIYEVSLGDSLTITDNNGVLSQYKVYSSDLGDVSINGNTLTVNNLNSRTTGDIVLMTKSYTEKVSLIYYSGSSQKIVRSGVLDPVVSSFTINVKSGSIRLKKLDKETGTEAQGDATLKGSKYYVINSAGDTVDILIAGQNERTKELPYDTYTVREVSAGNGYLVDDTVYTFTINDDNTDYEFEAYDEVFKQEFKIYKVYASDKTAELVGEPNITFDFYLKSSNQLYKSATTDNNGYLSINLPYGTYIVKQKNSTPNYEKCDDFEITIDFNNTDLTRMISDAEITAKLRLIKVDKATGNKIAISGIKFKIKNLDTNEYVCQDITYPTMQTICEYETDSNGEFITPLPLRPANYQVEEIDQKIDGYLWNNKPIKFTISEDSNFVYENDIAIYEVRFANQEVKGELNLQKYGEEFVIKDSQVLYVETLLDGVSFKLIANDDIYSANGTLVYSKDSVVKKFSTRQGSATISDLYLGKYCVVEESTVGNHILDDTPHCFELKYKDQYTDIVSFDLDLYNYLPKGSIVISKTDISTSEPIPNTLIEVYTEDGNLIYSGRTDENGNIQIDELMVGKYYFVEKEAAEGYVLNPEEMYFEISENGEVVKSEITNEIIKGTFDFTKTDFSTSEPIPNVLIEIYTEDNELVFSDRTNEEGKIVVELKYGKYYFVEKEAAEGYILNPEKMYFEIKDDGEIIQANMTNELIPVPSTNLNKNYYICFIALILTIVGIGMIINEENNKRK